MRTQEFNPVAAILDPDILKWVAVILFGIIGIVVVAVMLAFYPIFVFVIVGAVAAFALHFADEKIDSRYVFGVFLFIVVLGAVVVYVR